MRVGEYRPVLAGPRTPGCAPGSGLVVEHSCAQLLQGAAEQSRHVHLRDADLLTDLRLGAAVEEAQDEDAAFALGEAGEQRPQRRQVVDETEPGVELADALAGRDVVRPGGGVECRGLVVVLGVQGLDDLLQVDVEAARPAPTASARGPAPGSAGRWPGGSRRRRP
ncbi:hypothetical protein [Pseudonocardia sulfidoxydans]|uniref:hypothetical protein n=1 Tax=Pseudonocardia sulfidoxydans TaxID=54011 RepID=UPI00403A9C84